MLGYLFGMFALIICVLAVVTCVVEDMGLSLLALPILSPLLLVLFDLLSKSAWLDRLFGRGALLRWVVLGIFAGLFYTMRVILEESGLRSSLFSAGFLIFFWLLGWIMFRHKQPEK